MNTRLTNLVLTGVCLGLLGICGWLIYLLKTAAPGPEVVVETNTVTNTVRQIAVRKINATNLLAALAHRTLNWSQIESTNYNVYISNLRSIGCPEETIRDIIITDVAKLYARRRAALRAAYPYRYWATGVDPNGDNDPQLQQQLALLDREQRDLIQELLGVDYQTELAKYWGEPGELDERIYGFLPPEKRQRLAALQRKYDALAQEIYDQTRGVLLEEDQMALNKLEQQKQAELAQLLTPEEIEEYALRNSPTANALRYQMAGFQPTEEEFRKIFKLRQVFEQEFDQAFDPTDEAQQQVRARAEAEASEALNQEVKKILGDDRFNEYVRAQDDDYRALTSLSERLQLPQETADRVYNMKQEAERQKQRIDTNPALTEEQRQRALAAIARETEKSVSAILGDNAYEAYKRGSGQWIGNLSFSADAPAAPNHVR